MLKLTCISPIDGSVYAERNLQTKTVIDTIVKNAQIAQNAWKNIILESRIATIEKAVDALETMNDEIVVELAHMMGRPVRYGGEIGGVKERTSHMISIAADALAPNYIENTAAGTFVGVGLELGGKDPSYVRADADVDVAVKTLIDGAMFNGGQSCCGIERIYVDESLFDTFIQKAKVIVEAYVLGNPLDSATTLGPMANVRFADEVRGQVKDALKSGATSIINKSLFPRDTGSDAYIAPEILIDVDHTMRVMRDESFGPVVGIMKVSSDEQAIELMNDSVFGLTASIWRKDLNAAMAIGNQIETGTVFMNRCDYLDPALCWTGCKDTGRGISLSSLGYQSVTRAKSYHMKKA